jgi:hypothetical protein
MMRTHLRDEFELLLKIGAVDESQLGDEPARARGELSFGVARPEVRATCGLESPDSLATAKHRHRGRAGRLRP